jgi:hypothetical protein
VKKNKKNKNIFHGRGGRTLMANFATTTRTIPGQQNKKQKTNKIFVFFRLDGQLNTRRMKQTTPANQKTRSLRLTDVH